MSNKPKWQAYISCPTLGQNIIITDQTESLYDVEIVETSRLPKEYQEVEYIQSSGEQYIDTGYIPNNTSGIEIKAEVTSSHVDGVFIGCRESNLSDSRWYVGVSDNKTIYSGWNTNDSISSRPISTAYVPFVYQLNYCNNRKRICDNTEYTPISDDLTTITKSAYMFCANWAGTPNYYGIGCIYYCKITEGDQIVRYFIPCYRKSDNEIGLYDTVTKTFFTNQGTGAFTKGFDVPYQSILDKQENWDEYTTAQGATTYRILNTGYGYSHVSYRIGSLPKDGLHITSSPTDPGNIPPIDLSLYKKIAIIVESGYKVSVRGWTDTTTGLLTEGGFATGTFEYTPDGTYQYATVIISKSDDSSITSSDYNKALIAVYPK